MRAAAGSHLYWGAQVHRFDPQPRCSLKHGRGAGYPEPAPAYGL